MANPQFVWISDDDNSDTDDNETWDFDDVAEEGSDLTYVDDAIPGEQLPKLHAQSADECPPLIQISEVTLECGSVQAGDTIELLNRHGDFLVVVAVLEDYREDKVYLQGHRLRRAARFAPLFESKLNELIVVFNTQRYDTESAQTQGLELISTDQVAKKEKREVIFSTQPYKEFGIRQCSNLVPHLYNNPEAARDWLHDNGPLFARWVYVSIKDPNGKPYGGETRRLYHREHIYYSQLSQHISGRTMGDDDWVRQDPRQQSLTFGDLFCGAGGASYGAKEAGLIVKFGLDIEEKIMACYEYNHPGALPLCMDAKDFPSVACRNNFYCDFLHFSTTCRFFARCHTVDGKDDQINLETIFTVAAILKKLQPPYATAEQTDGLILERGHQKYFRILLNDIMSAGYNVRYQVIDLSTLGVPQRRRRLLFNMSKIGFPLAPFPNATHGPQGSGLKRFVTVADALDGLERSHQFNSDPLNQPRFYKANNCVPPYDPHTTLVKGTLTTSGGSNHHYSGKRKFTARENSQFQGFPLNANLGNTLTFSNMVVGNAYPVPASAAHILINAQTREAFDNGLINAEDEINDLCSVKRIWDTTKSRRRNKLNLSKYQYLNRLEPSAARIGFTSSLYTRNMPIEPLPPRPRGRPPQVIDRTKDRQRREVLQQVRDARYKGEVMELD
ncbi:unnamed protein product [Periconia digitata]|uniref:DNA (cytosine-5-)-methyltransferase n=1 Tax=Periconia digitata TaxID=1303443 RepID=A0A9W4UPL7_9PLEO|nr:unnamed protein product [Periconia digitata]